MHIIEANLNRIEDQRDVLAMTSMYALDVMGNDAPLPAEVLERLIPSLQHHPATIIFLAYDKDQSVGIATCFLGFSTFGPKTLINIHDLAVSPNHRGRGISRALLDAVETKARDLGCVKVTLEVQENNERARTVYSAAGFAQAVYGARTGGSLFYSKVL